MWSKKYIRSQQKKLTRTQTQKFNLVQIFYFRNIFKRIFKMIRLEKLYEKLTVVDMFSMNQFKNH